MISRLAITNIFSINFYKKNFNIVSSKELQRNISTTVSIGLFSNYRSPKKYVSLTLPRKIPPRRDPVSVSGLPMIGYMEQTVSTAVIKALTAVGCLKPKYPFLPAKNSALLYVAYHLKGICVYNSNMTSILYGRIKNALTLL